MARSSLFKWRQGTGHLMGVDNGTHDWSGFSDTGKHHSYSSNHPLENQCPLLNIALRDCGINAFAIVGVAMEVGIEPTVRHAADLGYIPVIVTDACGAGNESAELLCGHGAHPQGW